MKTFFFVLGFSVLCGLAPAFADDAAAEKARSLVTTLRKSESETARRDLYALGAPSLAPLAEAVSEEREPAAWTRLAETFEGVLRARLQELDQKLGRAERERDERTQKGVPISAPQGEAAAAADALEAEVRGAGTAAARELAREGAVRDELAALARRELLGDLLEKLEADVGGADAAGREKIADRLATLGPLAAPLLATAIAGERDKPALGAVATAARDRAAARFSGLLSAEDDAARQFAAESLFGLGKLALPSLERLAGKGTPDEKGRAARLARRIRWSISEELYRRTGHLLQGYEALSWQERRMVAYELEKQGGADAVPTLRRILEYEASKSLGVCVAAAEALARQGDPTGVTYLRALGMALLTQSPEVLGAIAMDQGIRYLQIRRYEKAIEEFNRVLEVQPENEIAYYNLACAFALRYGRDKAAADREKAFDYLEKSTQRGFEDADHVEKDEDLSSLRSDPRFKALVDQLRAKKFRRDGPQ